MYCYNYNTFALQLTDKSDQLTDKLALIFATLMVMECLRHDDCFKSLLELSPLPLLVASLPFCTGHQPAGE